MYAFYKGYNQNIWFSVSNAGVLLSIAVQSKLLHEIQL